MSLLLGEPWSAWAIVTPMFAATAAFLLPRQAARVGLAAALVVPLMVAAVVLQVHTLGSQSHVVGGWEPPLGIALRTDGLSLMLLVATALVGLVVSLYALGYFAGGVHEPQKRRYFWPLWMFLWGACNALAVSGDLFNLYVTLEMVTLASVALTAMGGGIAALSAAMRYLLSGLVGSLAYLLGVALLYGAYGTVDLALLGQVVSDDGLGRAALALMVSGLLLKTALFPLHFWLPPAHSMAPAPVSALLSALVVKTSYLILLRLWFEVFPAVVTPAMGQLLGGLGAAAILWGSLMALRQERLKLLVAYSTVAQLGYLFLVFPLAQGEATATAWAGVVFFVLAHACGKAAMFLVAGTIYHTAGHDRIAYLAGAGGPLGVQVVVFALAAVTIIGLPPSGGFMAKWMLLNAAIVSGQWWYLVVMALGSLLAGAYVLRVLSWAFLDVQRTFYPTLAWTLRWPPLALALVALLLGLVAFMPVHLALIDAPTAGPVLLEVRP
ncbi:multisubunit sodium/proton antiporter, MrpD subunit [Geoalkalibacter ferrihydriticus]|uniref:Oxidoreductase n=2 Tax=Geoalkalibacter ferrihydriticus TaxID=392333 RepID=A0A0C2HFJ8_9BACT|nr:proton-conducting transporter membrane subunit [Geoalkalibacter ferrihydriticus]KIH75696.1 oxidoreductase [Geoalkalibacter ferrihydriticus DSM 17813]SDM74136.1 multisubunit sodium/proton antiporter, MrpD subunit [Geoalkalibacter ferrihydriticus]